MDTRRSAFPINLLVQSGKSLNLVVVTGRYHFFTIYDIDDIRESGFVQYTFNDRRTIEKS